MTHAPPMRVTAPASADHLPAPRDPSAPRRRRWRGLVPLVLWSALALPGIATEFYAYTHIGLAARAGLLDVPQTSEEAPDARRAHELEDQVFAAAEDKRAKLLAKEPRFTSTPGLLIHAGTCARLQAESFGNKDYAQSRLDEIINELDHRADTRATAALSALRAERRFMAMNDWLSAVTLALLFLLPLVVVASLIATLVDNLRRART